ncbi:MAG: FAD binding domain-containing protein, partial [Spirochaetes bacterium]|nr:FAD binding domain-containing protein [Spirochaetota bacterium]
MIITDDFDYFKPVQISEAVKIFDKYKNKALLLAGGTDLIVKIKEDIEHPKVIIDLKGIRELKKLEFKNNSLYIGAGVTFGELLDDQTVNKKFPLLWESIRTVGSVGIRNRATLAGNICSAVPSLDSGPALLCYEAHVHVTGRSGKRKIAISSWFTGPKKNALKTGEIVLGITIPFPGKKHTGCYVKLGRYRGEDLAQAGVGILLLKDHTWRIGFCALGPV